MTTAKKRVIREHVVLPLARRLGSIAAGYVAGRGFPEEIPQAVELAVVAVCLIAADLVAAYIERKRK